MPAGKQPGWALPSTLAFNVQAGVVCILSHYLIEQTEWREESSVQSRRHKASRASRCMTLFLPYTASLVDHSQLRHSFPLTDDRLHILHIYGGQLPRLLRWALLPGHRARNASVLTMRSGSVRSHGTTPQHTAPYGSSCHRCGHWCGTTECTMVYLSRDGGRFEHPYLLSVDTGYAWYLQQSACWGSDQRWW